MNFVGLLLVFLLLFPMVIQFHPDIAFPITLLIILFGYMIYKGYNFLDTCLFFLLILLCIFFKIKHAIIFLTLICLFFFYKFMCDKLHNDTHINYKKTRRE